jgi:hypothetical protein
MKMDSLSRNILSVLIPFSVLFSKPSWKKALTLLLGTLLCNGKRTVCSALRAMGLECESGFSKYHHLLKWRGSLISRKAKTIPSLENITPEMLDWMDDIVRRVLQAA